MFPNNTKKEVCHLCWKAFSSGSLPHIKSCYECQQPCLPEVSGRYMYSYEKEKNICVECWMSKVVDLGLEDFCSEIDYVINFCSTCANYYTAFNDLNIKGEPCCAYCYKEYMEHQTGTIKSDEQQAKRESIQLVLSTGANDLVTDREKTTMNNTQSTIEVPRCKLRHASLKEIKQAIAQGKELPLPTLVYEEEGIELDLEALRMYCEMGIEDYALIPGSRRVECGEGGKDGTYVFIDRGADILAVAHRDHVVENAKHFYWAAMANDNVIYTPVLDDRLGCWIINNVLPKMGFNFDILFTEGEETGNSTAAFFPGIEGKQYKFIVEFDRKEDDAVTYQFDRKVWEDALKDSGFKVNKGMFSDIGMLSHLKACAVNIGCGYKDYHSERANASINQLYQQLVRFKAFMAKYGETYFEFDEATHGKKSQTDRYREARGCFKGSGSKTVDNNNGYRAYKYHRDYSRSESERTLIGDYSYNHTSPSNVIYINDEKYLVFLDEDATFANANNTDASKQITAPLNERYDTQRDLSDGYDEVKKLHLVKERLCDECGYQLLKITGGLGAVSDGLCDECEIKVLNRASKVDQ